MLELLTLDLLCIFSLLFSLFDILKLGDSQHGNQIIFCGVDHLKSSHVPSHSPIPVCAGQSMYFQRLLCQQHKHLEMYIASVITSLSGAFLHPLSAMPCLLKWQNPSSASLEMSAVILLGHRLGSRHVGASQYYKQEMQFTETEFVLSKVQLTEIELVIWVYSCVKWLPDVVSFFYSQYSDFFSA